LTRDLHPIADCQSRGGRTQPPPYHSASLTRIRQITPPLAFLFCAIASISAAQSPPQSSPAQAIIHRPPNRVRVLRFITLESSDSAGDVFCFACSVRVRGRVVGDIITIGGNVLAEGPVEGDVFTVGGGIEVRSPGRLAGDAFALGGYIEKTGGGVVARDSLAIPYVIIPGQLSPTALGSVGLAVINLVLVALAFAVLRPQRVENVAMAVQHRSGSVIFSGLLAVILFYAANSVCTFLGRKQAIPEVILGAIFIIVAAIGATGIGYWAASYAFPNTKGKATTLAGILTLTFLEIVPYAGAIVALIGVILSLGAAVVSAFGTRAVSPPAPPQCDPIS